MIRLSVSDLESYRYWKDSDDSDFAALVAKLRHLEPPTKAMEAGRAFAEFFEHVQAGEVEQASIDGWTFGFELEEEITVPEVRELKAEMHFDTPSGPVTLVGKVDSLDGLTIHDQKLTERFDAERYLDSLQWRAYLLMFGAETFVYDIFLGQYTGRFVRVHEYHRVPFYVYPNLRDDVQRAVEELAEVVVSMPSPAPEMEAGKP